MENIFSTLYKYKPQLTMTPTENYFTESFRYILDMDESLCDAFIKYISPDKKFIAPYNIESQKKYGNSIIDLHITDKRGEKILVEIKVSAKENRYLEEDEKNEYGQIEKYLRLDKGHVCFIAREETEVKITNNKKKYLGQFEWFEIYQFISDYAKSHKLDKIKKTFINNFLNFMKELEMQPFDGFDKHDLKLSQTDCFSFVNKLIEFLRQAIKDPLIKKFLNENKLEVKFNSPKYYEKLGQVSVSLATRKWNSHTIEFGFIFNDSLDYYQGIWMDRKYSNFFNDFKIKSLYFAKSEEVNWLLDKYISFSDFIKRGDKRAIEYMYKYLVELKRLGILDKLDKVD